MGKGTVLLVMCLIAIVALAIGAQIKGNEPFDKIDALSNWPGYLVIFSAAVFISEIIGIIVDAKRGTTSSSDDFGAKVVLIGFLLIISLVSSLVVLLTGVWLAIAFLVVFFITIFTLMSEYHEEIEGLKSHG